MTACCAECSLVITKTYNYIVFYDSANVLWRWYPWTWNSVMPLPAKSPPDTACTKAFIKLVKCGCSRSKCDNARCKACRGQWMMCLYPWWGVWQSWEAHHITQWRWRGRWIKCASWECDTRCVVCDVVILRTLNRNTSLCVLYTCSNSPFIIDLCSVNQ